MAVSCLLTLYTFFLTLVYGVGLYRLATTSGLVAPGESPRIDLLSLAGLCFMTVLLGFLSVFFPIGLEVHIALLAAAIAYALIDFKGGLAVTRTAFRASANRITWLIWLPCAAGIILYSALSPSMFDSGLYHAQTVQWIEKYRAVKGLGNLNGRIAFNSAYFLPCAFFGFSFLKAGPFHLLNAFLTMLFSFSLASYLTCANRRSKAYGIICAILFYSLFRLVADHWRIPSPTPDSLATYLIWFVALAFLFRRASDRPMEYDFVCFTLVCLAFFSVTVKLSTFPLLLAVPYVLFLCRPSVTKKGLIGTGVGAVLILAPWITRNLILSGYPVFPYPGLDFFAFDWKVPRVDVVFLVDFIRGWTRVPFPDDPAKALSMPLLTWFPLWYDEHKTIDKVVFILASVSPLLLLIHLKRLRQDMDCIVLWAVSYIGVVYWFLSAPDPRFGYGFMCLSAALVLYVLGTRIPRDIFSSMAFRIMLMVFVFFWGFYVVRDALPRVKANDPQWLAHRGIVPGKYLEAKGRVEHAGTIPITIVTDGFGSCWYAPLPCTNGLRPGLKPRGTDVSDGFRVEGQ